MEGRVPVVKPPKGIATYTVPQSKYAALRDVNPVRFWISAPSNSGKTVLILSWLLDIMRDRYDVIYLFSPSADLDPSWAPLKKYCLEVLGRDQNTEPWYWSDWSDQRVHELIEEQKEYIQEQRRNGQRRMRSVIFVIDDWADSEHMHQMNGPLASLMCRGRHFHASTILSTQKLTKLSTITRCNANIAAVFAFHSFQDADMFINEYAQLASEDGEDGRDNLKRLLAHATREKHSFLFINFKAEPAKRFMIRFEKYLTITNDDHEKSGGSLRPAGGSDLQPR